MKDYRRTTRFGGMFTFGLALAMLALFLPGNSASAQSDPEIGILIGSTTGQPGSQVDIDVDIETNGAEPSVIVLTLLYDATKLSFVEVVRGESAIQAEKIVDTNNEPGQLGIIIWGGRTFLKNGTLFTVTFAIRSVAPSGVLTVAGDGSESAVDANAGRILVNIEPGSITVTAPAAPTGVSASDGTYTDKVRVIWNAVPNAEDYRVYRDGTALGDWQSDISYDDHGAEPAEVVSRCGVNPRIIYHKHTYRVKARIGTEQSSLSASDTGFRGAAKALDGGLKVYEERLPIVAATPFSKLALRLNSVKAIDPNTVWARVEGNGWYEEGGLWRPTDLNDNSDGWVVFVPAVPWPAGETVTLIVGALTTTGDQVGPISHNFLIGSEKSGAAYSEEAAFSVVVDNADVPPLDADVVSAVYQISPSAIFENPVPIWIPVPEGANLQSLEIYYFSQAEEHRGWYLGENVIGWISRGSRAVVEKDGHLFLEIQVNHSGIVQLADGQSLKVQADAGIFLAMAAVLGMKYASRRRKKK